MRDTIRKLLLTTIIPCAPVGAMAHDTIALEATGGEIVHGHTYGPALTYDNIVIRGAKVFHGCREELVSVDVLVTDNLIAEIGPDLEAPNGAFEIIGDGHTLIPGLIDAHWHGVYAEATIPQILTTGEGY